MAFSLLAEFCIGYLVWPENGADFPEASIVEGFDLFNHYPALYATEYNRFDVAVLYSDLGS